MKKILFVIFFFLTSIFLFSSNFEKLYEMYLEGSSDYLYSYLNYLSAKRVYERDQIFTPKFFMSTRTSMIYSKDGWNKFQISLGLNFFSISDLDFSISFPVEYDGEALNFKFDKTSLEISKNVFSKNFVNKMENKAQYLNALNKLNETKNEILIRLVEDIFDYYINSAKLNLLEKKLDIYEDKYSKLKDEDERKKVKKEILLLRKNISSLKYYLEISKIKDYYTQELLEETVQRYKNLKIPNSFKKEYSKRYDIIAQKIEIKAEEYDKNLWFFSILPNITISLNIPFDDYEKWNLAVSFSYNIDFPTITFEFFKKDVKTEKVKYNELLESLEKAVQKYLLDLKNYELDKEKAILELEDLQEDFLNKEKLYSKNYLSKEDFELAKLDLELKKLDIKSLELSIILTKLNLLKTLGRNLY